MQLAAKLLLEGPSDFLRLIQDPSLRLEKELVYTDYFFDSSAYLLQQDDNVLRLRLPKSTEGTGAEHLPSLTLKDHNRVESGDQASIVYTVENLSDAAVKQLLSGVEPLEVLRQHYSMNLNDPTSHISTMIKRLESVVDATGIPQEISLVGSTETHRRVCKHVPPTHDANGETIMYAENMGSNSLLRDVKIRLDETEFPFGKRYEVEVVVFSDPLNDVRVDIEKFLSSLSIRYSWSLESKSSHLMKYLKALGPSTMEIKGARMCIGSAEGYNEVLNWLTNHCRHASFASFAALPSQQEAENAASQPGDVGKYSFCATGEMLLASQGARNMFTQSQQHWSQRTTASSAACNVPNPNPHADDDREEYQENYYFDDCLNGTLQMHYCVAELRCINQGAAFVLSLKRNQCVVNGSQSSSRSQSEISGDVARRLLSNPTDFLITFREHNNVANMLWEEYGMRVLNVVAFHRTKRHIFARPITAILPTWTRAERQRHQMSDDDDFDSARWDGGEAQRPASMSGQMPSININVDYTLLDCITPATHFSAIAAQRPSCSYATASAFSPTRECVSLYEVEVTGLTEEHQEAAKQWLAEKLRNRGVELTTADKTRTQKYMDLLFERQRRANVNLAQ